MGMDLEGTGGYFRWTYSGWSRVLELAVEYGWEPVGTGPPRGTLKRDWLGSYDSNERQLLYARDAKNLADALEKALKDIPEREVGKRKVNANKTAREFFSGWGQDSLTGFIVYCRKGSFRIF